MDRFADAWRTNHAYLVDLAFRMLGDVGDAEDVVQEAFTRLSGTEPGDIADDRGWLTVVTSRLCLDQIRSARSRHEYPQDTATLAETAPPAGPDPADRITLDDDVRLAMFMVLARLSPAERVAFVLHDVFRTPFDTIASTLGKPVGTCRQLARRARAKIAATPSRQRDVPKSEHRLVTERFIAACANGDVDALLAVLDPDVWGSARFAADFPVGPQVGHGSDVVAANLLRYYGKATLVSYPPGVLAYFGHELFAIISLTVTGDRITKIDVCADPVTIATLIG